MKTTTRILSIVLALAMLLSVLSIGAFAVEISEKPANGTTTEQPFATGTGGSTNFRIPGIVTLDNGTIIAACDARWNHTGDGAGLDTIVSASTDNGATWTYTFANYLGDNGNTYNNLSTCIIDPAIGTDGTTAYLIADLFPAGIALNTSRYSPIAGENGFDDNGNLMLRALADDTVAIGESGYNSMAAAANYAYYLDLETLELCNADGTKIEGYTVDAYFNITGEDGTDTNLFFSDSPYQPYPTDYLYMTTSTDGLTWSVPTLLNLQEEDEQTLLIGPGNGTYNETKGHMVFTAYEYTSGYQRTSLIWKDAEGSWHRTEDATVNSWSSEASVVALADGTMRCFYRDGYSNLRYTDFVWSEADGNYIRDSSATEVSTSATKTYNNQLSAIAYSEQIDGKDVILVSTANTGTNSRRNGYLYVFLVSEDKSMELAYGYDILPGTDDYYAYSCITELSDGTIGLLYEGDDGGTGAGKIFFKILDLDDVLVRDNDARLNFVDVSVLTEESITVTDGSGNYTGADTSELNSAIATAAVSGSTQTTIAGQLGSDSSYSGDLIDLTGCLYTFTQNENGYWVINSGDVYLNTNGTTGYPHAAESCTFTIEASTQEEGTFYIRSTADSNAKGDANYLYFDRAAYNWNRVNNLKNNTTWMTNCSMSLFQPVEGEGSGEISGYQRITSLDDVTEGQYLIGACGNDGSWYVAYPTTAATNRYCQTAKLVGGTTIGKTEVTFTGVTAGYSEVQIGSTVYRVTVLDYYTEELTATVGETTTVDIDGEYTDASSVDTSIAEVSLSAADGITTMSITGVYPGTTSLTLGRTQYVITVNGTLIDVDLEIGDTFSYVISGETMTEPDASVATVASDTFVGIQLGTDATFSGDYADLATCLYAFSANDDGTWYIFSNDSTGTTVYIDAHAGAGNGGYPNRSAAVKLTLVNGTTEGTIKIKDDGGVLHFWDNNDSKLHWDQCTSDNCTGHNLYFFRPAEAGETESEILPGYVQVMDVSEIDPLHQYLILGHANSGGYYVLRPSTDYSSKYSHIAKIANDAAALTITGVAAGETSFRVDSTIFEITVSEHEHLWDEGTVTTDATCTTPGAKLFTCSTCGETKEEEIEVLDHTYENGTCTVCGAADPDYVKPVVNPFEDVIEGKYYYEAVLWAAENGITEGISDTLFDPDGECTRAMAVTLLWRAAGEPEPTITENPFSDVVAGKWYYKAVLWAAEKGITEGYADTDLFGTEDICSRAHIATFLYRYAGNPAVSGVENPFSDVIEGKWYTEAVLWAVENDITNGYKDQDLFGTYDDCTRGHIVTFLYRYEVID